MKWIKPDKIEDQVSMLWEACFNHIPSQLHFQELKINFVLMFLGLILALIGVLIVLVV